MKQSFFGIAFCVCLQKTCIKASYTGGFSDKTSLLRLSQNCPVTPVGPLVFDQLVHMMLGSMLAGGDLKNEGYAEQGFLGIPVRNNLREE